MKESRKLSFDRERLSWSLLVFSFILALLVLGACAGSDEAEPEFGELNAGEELDTGYDATEILERLTSKEVYGDPEQIATLAADLNALKDSRDFHTAKRQAKELSTDFRNRPMQASMAAELMDAWNAKPPADITIADLEQAWAIRRIAKKTDEELARERALQVQDRQSRQSEVDAHRRLEEQEKEQEKVDGIGIWIASYRAATTEGRQAVARVQASLADPSKKDDLGSACRALFQATQTMEGSVFRAPDPEIERPLGKAWERYRAASRSCMKGEMAYLTNQLGEAQRAMNEVKVILEGYGKTL